MLRRPDHPFGEYLQIDSGKYCDINEIESMIIHSPELFAPPFRELFRWYLKLHE